MTDERAAREAIVAAGRRLGARGLVVAAEGNLSIRLGRTLLVTPSGRRKDELAPDDIVEVDLDPPTDGTGGAAGSGGRPSSDLAIHRAIYRARPDVGAIAHAHLAASLALTIVGLAPDPADLPETAALLPRLPYIAFAPAGSEVLAAAVATAFTDRGTTGEVALANAVLLERHGSIAVGPDLVTAGDRLELVDLLCRVHRDVVLLRRAHGNGTDG
ncbi:MAG TPA: class II aldolase/adducin family protein [Candidatus Limnocylindrales bacterium]